MVERFDWLRAIRWVPFHDPEAHRFGIPQHILGTTVCTVSGLKQRFGFAAWKQILLRLPVVYLAVAASIAVSPWLAIAWIVIFAPVTAPAGERVYQWVARNRHRVPGATCQH